MNLSQEDWVNQLAADENAVILDVRTEDEFNDGYIENAVNIDIKKVRVLFMKSKNLIKIKITMCIAVPEQEVPKHVRL